MPAQEESELTVAQVYRNMGTEKQKILESAMTSAIHLKCPPLNICKAIESFSRYEKRIAYYLIGEAIHYGQRIFDMLECCLILEQYGREVTAYENAESKEASIRQLEHPNSD